MKIGEAARRSGVSVQTLRYYERRGLLPAVRRSAGNYREYDDKVVWRVRFIKRAQALGFELAEVRELLRLEDLPDRDPDEVRAVAERKVHEIDQRMRELSGHREALRALVASCEERETKSSCPILEALRE